MKITKPAYSFSRLPASGIIGQNAGPIVRAPTQIVDMTGPRSGSFRPRPRWHASESAVTNAATAPSEPSPAIEFWFEFGSNYSYLSVMRIEDAARRYGVRITWKPFLLGPIFRALGMETSPFLQQKEKGAYVWQDMVRQCRKYGLRWTKPSIFPRLGVLPARVALIGAEEPWIGAFCRTVMELNFALDEDINQPERLASILIDLNLPASEILDQAEAAPVKALLRQQTETARDKGIFGAPTFFVGQEMFWGNDRLDDALLLAVEHKQAVTSPRA
jgi:2-hydroxychromene-2-carboxylate isomerase